MTNCNFSTLNSFFNDTTKTVTTGDYIRTYGFSTVADGGEGIYKIISDSETYTTTKVFDGLKVTSKGYKLELIPENNTVHVEQFGGIGVLEGVTHTEGTLSSYADTNKNAIQKAIDSGAGRVEFGCGKQYYVRDGILIAGPVDIKGNGAKLIFRPSAINVNTHLFCLDFEADEGTRNTVTNITDMCIVGVNTASNTTSIPSIRMKCAYRVIIANVNFDGGDYAVYAKKRALDGYDIDNVRIINCTAVNMNNGFAFYTATDVKIQNCRVDLADSELFYYGTGVVLNDNSKRACIEDLSIFNSSWYGVVCSNNIWDNNADSRILFKNLLIDGANFAIGITSNAVPIHFANTMVVDSTYGFYIEDSKNINTVNSSIALKSPIESANEMLAVGGYAQAKFTHTQFEFPFGFQRIAYSTSKEEPVDIAFVDCTLQKTDVPDISDAIIPSGFGTLGYTGGNLNQVIETFDACEFRSYIQDYSITAGEGETTTTTYNFPVTLSTASDSGSKLIIKNCRFVNDKECTIPYFKLDDGAKFDNVVVYNCFFENYSYTNSSGQFTAFDTNASNHNIFAKSNMRSSKPARDTGTTINEMLQYE